MAQVRDIFTGRVTNGQQVGGPNLPVLPLSRNLQVGGTVDPMSAKLGTTPAEVGYATVSEVVNQSMVCIVPIAKEAGSPYVTSDINGQKVNLAVISNGTYPITRHLFVIIRWDGTLDEKANVAYANLFLSDEGQQLVQAAGFASLR